MATAVELRACQRSDVDAVLSLWRKAEAVPRPTDRVGALIKRLNHGDGLFLVAVGEAQIVGTLIGGWDGWRGGLYRLAVDPKFAAWGSRPRSCARSNRDSVD
jgi:ribosomal protein S18 acetylase RimI-like enzyme